MKDSQSPLVLSWLAWYLCSGPSGDASRLQTGPSADGTAHLPTFCPVCRRDRRQTGRPICKHFVPSANICDATTNLATFSTRDAATLGAGRIAQPFIEHLAHSAVLLFAFCQVFSPSCKFLFLRWKMATRELFEQYCERFGGSKSKVINRQKGEQIVKALAEGHQDRHFRHFIKSKGFSRLTCEQLGLENVLCVPVSDKEKVL